jgi:hypothetical protein
MSSIQAAFVRATANASQPAAVAAAAVAVWLDVSGVLSPIIGHSGFAALFKRSVHLASDACPGLAKAAEQTPGAAPFSALHDALAQLPCTDAARANGALLQTFQEVLDTLIGVPLTARLLQPIWDIHIVQDTTS